MAKKEPVQVDIIEQIMPKTAKPEPKVEPKQPENNTYKAKPIEPKKEEVKIAPKREQKIIVTHPSLHDDSDEFQDVQQPESKDKEIDSLNELIPLLRPALLSKTISENKG